MSDSFKGASETAMLLGQNAEAVCHYYLSNGRRAGNYWLVGNVWNEKGRSLYVRLRGASSGPQAAGKWVDAATGEYGDLLDLIRIQGNYHKLKDAVEEAHAFFALPRPEYIAPSGQGTSTIRTDTQVVAAAHRLFNSARPIGGSIAETYLSGRGITVPVLPALRFHPHVYYLDDEGKTAGHPALLAAVHDNDGKFTAVNRIWIDRQGSSIAPIRTPKKALGQLLGHAVRFGKPGKILIVGEGIETILSLKTVRPDLAMAAALTANHLAAFIPPPDIKHLIIARDNDDAGKKAARALAKRSLLGGINPHIIVSNCNDFNLDLNRYGKAFMADRLTEILVDIYLKYPKAS